MFLGYLRYVIQIKICYGELPSSVRIKEDLFIFSVLDAH